MSFSQVLGQIMPFAYTMLIALGANYVIRRIQEILSSRGHDDVVEPPQVPCWIPYIGSSVEMGQDIVKFIQYRSQKFGDTPIFSATIGGKLCHFIGSSENITCAYKGTTSLNYDTIGLEFIHKSIGMSWPDCIKLYDSPHYTQLKSLVKKYFQHEEALHENVQKSQLVLHKRLAEHSTGLLTAEGGGWTKVPLYDFCLTTIFDASVSPVISTSMGNRDDLAYAFKEWNDGITLLYAGVPGMFLKKTLTGREALVDSMMTLEFLEGASEHFKKRHELYPTPELTARANMGLVFAAVGNSIPSVFWMLARILADRKAKAAIETEIASLVANTGKNKKYFSIDELDKLVVVDAIWTEVLRLYQVMLTPRDLKKDLIVNLTRTSKGPTKFLLKQGTRLMGCMAVRHCDSEVFENPQTFVWDRFLPTKVGKAPVFTKNGKAIDDPTIFFGHGTHKCPGQRFIENEMKALVVALFSSYDMRLAEGETIPGADPVTQGTGVTQPSREMYIDMKLKAAT